MISSEVYGEPMEEFRHSEIDTDVWSDYILPVFTSEIDCEDAFAKDSVIGVVPPVRQSHLTGKKSGTMYPCEDCGRLYISKRSRWTHIYRKHRGTVDKEPEVDEEEVVNSDGLRDKGDSSAAIEPLRSTAEGSVDLTCAKCGRRFASPETLRNHVRGFHTTERRFSCLVCQKRFKYQRNLVTHRRQNHADFVGIWPDAPPDETKETAVAELSDETPGIPEPEPVEDASTKATSSSRSAPWACDICGLAYVNRKSLWTHKRRKHFEEPPEPELSLVYHNTGFLCPICDKAFDRERDLTTHMDKHYQETLEKSSSLNTSGTADTGSISSHSPFDPAAMMEEMNDDANDMDNSDTGNFPCPQCSKLFKSKRTLTAHTRFVHDLSGCRFPCHICGKSFKYKRNIQSHIKAFHKL